MRFGAFYDIRNFPQSFKPWPQFYGETLDHMSAMDEIGFEAINITEHHFDDDGYCPSVLTWNAFAATRTKRARLGQEIMVLPLHHPVEVAEQLATIDIMSNGRVWLRTGQGGGVGDTEYRGYNLPRSGRRYREQLEIISKCFEGERFSYEGRYFNLSNVKLMPMPVQRPRPPMNIVATPGAPSMDFAVKMGFGTITANGGPQGLPNKDAWSNWHSQWAAAVERGGKKLSDFETSDFIALFVTDDPEREWERHKNGLIQALDFYHRSGAGQLRRFEKPEDVPNWQNLFQTPESAVQYLKDIYGATPPTWVIMWANRPGMTYEESYQYHKNFMEKVAPHFHE